MATGTHELGDYTIEDDGNNDYVLKEPDGNIIHRWDDSAGDWYINDGSGSPVIKWESSAGEIQFNSNALTGVASIDGLSATAVSNFEGSGLSVDGSGNLNVSATGGYATVSTTTSDTTATDREVVLVDASGGAVTVTLPAPSEAQLVTVKKIDDSSNTATIATPGSETIDGQSSIDITNQYAARETTSDGSNYFII